MKQGSAPQIILNRTVEWRPIPFAVGLGFPLCPRHNAPGWINAPCRANSYLERQFYCSSDGVHKNKLETLLKILSYK